MSGLRFLGAKKLNDLGKPFALLGGGLYIVDGDIAEQENVSELPGVDAQIRNQTLTKF